MYNLRICLFYSYIAYSFCLPSILIFLFVIYKNLSSFLISLIIIDTILFAILLVILYWLHNEKQQLWLYILFIIINILITVRNLYLFIAIIYRTMTEFEKKKTIFMDAIHRQINVIDEPQHPVWKMILLKQCCGLNGKYSQRKMIDYQWFEQTPFALFCSNIHLQQEQIIEFENRFQRKYSPQGPCLPLVNNELKIELILISISLGFSVLLMLLTWLFIWQNRLVYLELLKNVLRKQKKDSIINTNKPSIISVTEQTDVTETPTFESKKRLYQGYLTPLEDLN